MRPSPQLAILFLIASAPVVHPEVGRPWPFTRHPHSQHVYLGHSVRLIGASGDQVSSYRWLKFGQPIPDELGVKLELLHALPNDAGPYQLLAWNAANEPGISTIWESASEPAWINVMVPPESPGVVDWEFGDAGLGKGEVRALAVDALGRVLAGGDFTDPGKVGRIALLTADGSPDPDFDIWPGADDKVRAVVTHRDGWVVGGDFESFHGTTRKRVARLLPNGALDPSFIPPSITGDVRALAIQRIHGEDRVLVGMSGEPFLMRLRENGSEDLEFSATVGAAGLNNGVNCLAVQADGAVVLGGLFYTSANWPASAWPFSRVGRLLPDGSPDRAGFFRNASSIGANGEVSALALDAQGRILVGGAFTTIHGVSAKRLARLDAGGRIDPSFHAVTGDPIVAVAVLNTGEIAAAGGFDEMNGETCPTVALLQPNGSLVPAWQTSSFDGEGNCLAVGLADRLFVGGAFSQPHAGVVALRTRAFNSPPQILSVPTSQELTLGTTGVISIAVRAHPGTKYHWYRIGQAGNVTITTTADWIIPRVEATDAGTYMVDIYDQFGRVTAGPIDIRVTPRPVGARPHQLGLPAKLPLDAPDYSKPLNIAIPMAAFEVEDVRVTLAIDHDDINDLALTLFAPGGGSVSLVDPEATRLLRGKNFHFTVFADQADRQIYEAGAPFVGTFGAHEPGGLKSLQRSYPAGQWTIEVRDGGEDGDIARVRFASIDLFGPAQAIGSDSMEIHALPDRQPELQWHSETRIARLHHWQPHDAPTPDYESAETLTSWRVLPKTTVLRHRLEYDQTATTELQLPATRVHPHVFFRASWPVP